MIKVVEKKKKKKKKKKTFLFCTTSHFYCLLQFSVLYHLALVATINSLAQCLQGELIVYQMVGRRPLSIILKYFRLTLTYFTARSVLYSITLYAKVLK